MRIFMQFIDDPAKVLLEMVFKEIVMPSPMTPVKQFKRHSIIFIFRNSTIQNDWHICSPFRSSIFSRQ